MSVTKRTTGEEADYFIRKQKISNIQATYQVHYYVETKYFGSKIKMNKFKLRGIPLRMRQP